MGSPGWTAARAVRVVVPVVVAAFLGAACAGSEIDPTTPRTSPATARPPGSVRPLPANGPPDAAAGAAADPSLRADVTVWIDVAQVPVSGGDIAVAVRNRSADPVSYGVGGSIEWWDGGAWVDPVPILTCLDSWPCLGKIETPGKRLDVPGVLLTAPPGQFGPIETITVSGLDPGWYRVVKALGTGAGGETRTRAVGAFAVADGAPLTAPVAGDRAHRLTVSPPIIGPAGGVVRLHVVLNGGAGGSAEELARVEPSLSSNASLERWDGSRWVEQGTLALDRGGVEAGGLSVPQVTIPPLEPGSYRLVRRLTGGRAVPGALFVVA